jgi:hypothetical protein
VTQELPPEFLDLLQKVTGKRARIVVEHILKHEFITSEDIERLYGYKHPPRAIRDVREQGIPIVSFAYKDAQGKTIAAYRFGDYAAIRAGRLGGRRTFSKAFKSLVIDAADSRCAICQTKYEPRYFQVDHRIPYEVIGDIEGQRNPADHMPLCGSCNRAKSWSCEHCKNWLEVKDPEICKTCYWTNPSVYQHIALRPIRRLDIVWTENEVEVYEHLKQLAEVDDLSLPDYIKLLLKKSTEDE